MERASVITSVRRYLGDLDGNVFPASVLERYLDRAVAEWFKDSGCARGEFPILADSSGTVNFPSDYCGILTAYNDLGLPIAVSTSTWANDDSCTYTTATGEHVEAIYRDQSEDGCFRVYPLVTQEVEEHHAEETDGGYGICTQMYGTAFASLGYGATTSWSSFPDKGSVVYYRQGDFSEVTDANALVYHVLAQAYSADTDLMNSSLSSAYASLYRERVGVNKGRRSGDAYAPRNGNYF